MLDINYVREFPDIVRESLKKRRDEDKIKWVDEVLKLDAQWKSYKKEVDDLRHSRNVVSEQINRAKKEGNPTVSDCPRTSTT